MFDVTERVRNDSDNAIILTSPPLQCDCLLAASAACFYLPKWLKLIELVRKCEELYDMSNNNNNNNNNLIQGYSVV